MGLDLASVADLTAAVVVTVPEPDEPFYVVPFAWVPGKSIKERSKVDRVPYDVWQKQGFIEKTPGSVVNYDVILKRIEWIAKTYDLQGICFDRWGSQKIISDIGDMGIDVIEMGQGYASLSAPVAELERLILDKGIVFPDDPVLRWNFGNIVIEQDGAGNRKFSKGRAIEKIDLCVALIMGLDGCIRNRVEEIPVPKVAWL